MQSVPIMNKNFSMCISSKLHSIGKWYASFYSQSISHSDFGAFGHLVGMGYYSETTESKIRKKFNDNH